LLGSDVRERLMQVKQSLRELQAMLSGHPLSGPDAFVLQQPRARPAPKKVVRSSKGNGKSIARGKIKKKR
jgi:hypothetical protein